MFSNQFLQWKKKSTSKLFLPLLPDWWPGPAEELHTNVDLRESLELSLFLEALQVIFVPSVPENLKDREGESSILSTSHNASAQPGHPSFPGAIHPLLHSSSQCHRPSNAPGRSASAGCIYFQKINKLKSEGSMFFSIMLETLWKLASLFISSSETKEKKKRTKIRFTIAIFRFLDWIVWES